MSSPIIWIFLPLIIGSIFLIIGNQKLVVLVATMTCVLLSLSAILLPIDTSLSLGSFSLKISPSIELLGRKIILDDADRSYLALIYGGSAFWFVASASIQIGKRLIPIGLLITALLVSTSAVEPFLYAALFIEIAVLLAIPLVNPPDRKPGKGVLRFLIFQTLAMPFILFSGWLLTSIEGNFGDLGSITQAIALLGMGFAFLLAIFPFYTWIPLLAEETHPFIAGFIMWIFPTTSMFFGLGFLDQYSWLSGSSSFILALQSVGAIMIVSGGLLFIFQHHLGRLMAYAVIIETGFSLLGLGMGIESWLQPFYLLLLPRIISLTIWAYCLSIIDQSSTEITENGIKGIAHRRILTSVGLILAMLSLTGMPLLASFPGHVALLTAVWNHSQGIFFWILLGSGGMFLGSIRIARSLFETTGTSVWSSIETRSQKLFLLLGWLLLFFFGLFPQWILKLWTHLPSMTEHLR